MQRAIPETTADIMKITGINGDIHADAEYRAHLIGVMAKQAVAQATGKG